MTFWIALGTSERRDPLRRTSHGKNSTIQMRTARFREDFPALGWVKKGGKFEKDKRRLKRKLAAAGVDFSMNTTRGVSWGLLDTAKGEIGGKILVPETKSWASSVEHCPEVLPVLPTSPPLGLFGQRSVNIYRPLSSPQTCAGRF
jgi:hypothetical protein